MTRRRLCRYSLSILAALAVAATLLGLWPAEPAEAGRTKITSVAITSTPASGDTYGRGETIAVTVNFDGKVQVVGHPVMVLQVGCKKGTQAAKVCQRKADYVRWDKKRSVQFQYKVKKWDLDTDGIAIKKNAIRVTAASTIRKPGRDYSPPVKLKHGALAAQSGHKVDGDP